MNKRTWAVWLLIIIAVLAGLSDVLDAARYLGWLPVNYGSLTFYIPNANWLGALLAAVIGIIWFAVARWLYHLDPRGWVFVIVIAIVNLLLLLLAWLGSYSWSAVSLGVVLNGLALLLAILPGTKRAFVQSSSS